MRAPGAPRRRRGPTPGRCQLGAAGKRDLGSLDALSTMHALSKRTHLTLSHASCSSHGPASRGDLSEEFRLASFFPQPLQPPVDRIAGAVTRLTGLGAASTAAQQQQAGSYYGLGGAVLPGSDAGDAARRRERGAKALEERLGLKKSAAGAGSLPAAAAPPGSNGNPEAAGAASDAAAQAVEAGGQPDVEAGGVEQ